MAGTSIWDKTHHLVVDWNSKRASWLATRKQHDVCAPHWWANGSLTWRRKGGEEMNKSLTSKTLSELLPSLFWCLHPPVKEKHISICWYMLSFFLTGWHMTIMLNYVHKSQRCSRALNMKLNTEMCKIYFWAVKKNLLMLPLSSVSTMLFSRCFCCTRKWREGKKQTCKWAYLDSISRFLIPRFFFLSLSLFYIDVPLSCTITASSNWAYFYVSISVLYGIYGIIMIITLRSEQGDQLHPTKAIWGCWEARNVQIVDTHCLYSGNKQLYIKAGRKQPNSCRYIYILIYFFSQLHADA